MAYWLLKSEPAKYPWSQLVADGRTGWDGVRNHQAAANLKSMRIGDLAFFYHSNIGLEIVGVCKIIMEWYLDPSDESGRFGMVDVAPFKESPKPLSLKTIKSDPILSSMQLVRQSRLSVSAVTEKEWTHACKLQGI